MNLAERPHDPTRRRTLRAVAALAMVASIAVLRAAEPEIASFDLVSNEEGLLLSYNINMELSRSVDEALSKAVPLFFVAEADVFRSRFYWRDQRISQAVPRQPGPGVQSGLYAVWDQNDPDANGNVQDIVQYKVSFVDGFGVESDLSGPTDVISGPPQVQP